MINAKLYSDFYFSKVNFNKFHYTDNRTGSPYHYFACLEKGTARIVSEDKTIFVNEGDIFHIPKNLSYQSYWYGNDEISFFSYGCSNLLACDANFLDLQVIKCSQESSIALSSIPTDGTNVKIKDIGCFFSTVAMLLPNMKKTSISNASNTLIKAKEYLHTNPHCSNSQLATACGISIPYLYKIFKNTENESPNTYRQRVLCDKAKDILRTTDSSIEKISSMLDFSSSGYFRKIFKKYTGMTPREFRKLYYF